jgi:hypothetical protein
MSPWTDEQLSDLLHGTFAEREAQADPEVARRIALEAPPARRKAWPMIGAAAAVVLAVAGLQLVQHDRSRSLPRLGPPSASVTPVPPGHNREGAAQVADRLLREAPLPPLAVPQREESSRFLHELSAYFGDVDPSLTRTGYWIVPMSHLDLVDWYAAHTPANPDETKVSSSSTPEPQGVMGWEVGTSTASYTQPAMIVAYARLGPEQTALRIDVTLAARDDRTARTLVPASGLESVVITPRSVSKGQSPPPPVTVTDPSQLRALGDAFNRATGAAARAEPHPCGSPGNDYLEYAIVFRWPRHTLEATTGSPLCGVGRELRLDGELLPQKIGIDARLDDLLATLAKSG